MRKKNCRQRLYITLLCLFITLSIFSVTVYSCPHYDEYDDEYYWIFNDDGSSTMIYLRDYYERQMILDSDFNMEHEQFAVQLYFQNSKIPELRKLNSLNMGNREYWFDVEIDSIIHEKLLDFSNDLLYLHYNLIVDGLNSERHSKVFAEIESALSREKIEIAEGRIFELYPQYYYQYFNMDNNKEIRIRDFVNPIRVHFDLSKLNISDAEMKNIDAVYLDSNNKVSILKGTYNLSDNVLSFYANEPGIYGLVFIPEDNTTSESKDNFVESELIESPQIEDTPTINEENQHVEDVQDIEDIEEIEKEKIQDTIPVSADYKAENEENFTGQDIQGQKIDIELEQNQQKILLDITNKNKILGLGTGVVSVVFLAGGIYVLLKFKK